MKKTPAGLADNDSPPAFLPTNAKPGDEEAKKEAEEEEDDYSRAPSRNRNNEASCFELLRLLLKPLLKVLAFSIPLAFFDFGTDAYWTFKYLTSPVNIVNRIGISLLIVLIVNNCVSSFYGLSILMRQPEAYPQIWNTRWKRCLTIILHFLGKKR